MRNKNLAAELVLRFILFVIFTITDNAAPFRRALQPEELWLYRYPHTPDYYPGKLMWITVFSVPTIVFVAFYVVRRDSEDLIQATLGTETLGSKYNRNFYFPVGVTLSIYVAGCVTNFVKLAVGRPRPDFLSRCYPEGPPDHVIIKDTLSCYGNEKLVLEGLKSFPSGHTSLSFSSLGFVALYIAGKLQVFNQGRGRGWRFVSFIAPLIWALMIAVSRTSDYHHHWQDVTVGAIIGLVVCYSCYRQVYPSLYKLNSHLSYSQFPPVADSFDSSREDQDTPTSPHPKSRDTEFTFVSKIV